MRTQAQTKELARKVEAFLNEIRDDDDKKILSRLNKTQVEDMFRMSLSLLTGKVKKN